MNMKYKKAKSEIVLSKKHKEQRLNIITDWISKNHDWDITISSHEKRFSLNGPDDWRSYTPIAKPLIRYKRQCRGGGIMVWLMVLPNGLVAHRIIEGIFKSCNYKNLLQEMIVPIIRLNMGSSFYFQEDNCSVHKSRTIQDFMKASDINILKWPSKSPDLNIVEDICRVISDSVYDGKSFANKKDLIDSVNNCIFELNNDKRNIVFDLYKSIRSRLCTVLKNKGNLYNKICNNK